jgi:preprotein translocase subunit SecE
MAEAVKVRNDEERESGGTAFPGAEAAGKVTGKITGQWKRLTQFLHEVRVELRHVTWPTKSDVRATTVVVLVTIFFFGLFLFFVDWGLGSGVDRLFKSFRP